MNSLNIWVSWNLSNEFCVFRTCLDTIETLNLRSPLSGNAFVVLFDNLELIQLPQTLLLLSLVLLNLMYSLASY